MKGIIIAAGMGARLGPYTQDKPKCMVEVAGRPLLHHTLAQLTGVGCDEIVVIGGYKHEKIDAPGATIVVNDDYQNNNILHSLMYAREFLRDEVLCMYADVWVEPEYFRKVVDTPGDLVLTVDSEWRDYYEGRSDHPVTQAENAFYDRRDRIQAVGKHLDPGDAGELQCGEFLGLWRMSKAGANAFVDAFDAVDASHQPDDPFQRAARWKQAFVTDMFNEMKSTGHELRAAVGQRGWAEIDTVQDIERLPAIAERLGLHRYLGNL